MDDKIWKNGKAECSPKYENYKSVNFLKKMDRYEIVQAKHFAEKDKRECENVADHLRLSILPTSSGDALYQRVVHRGTNSRNKKESFDFEFIHKEAKKNIFQEKKLDLSYMYEE